MSKKCTVVVPKRLLMQLLSPPTLMAQQIMMTHKQAAAALSLKEPTQIEVYRTAIFQNILLFNLYVHYFV
jgi:hypothetical protein